MRFVAVSVVVGHKDVTRSTDQDDDSPEDPRDNAGDHVAARGSIRRQGLSVTD